MKTDKPRFRITVPQAALLAAALLLRAPLSADTAEAPPQGVLRIDTALSAASALDAWGAATENLQFIALGLGAEYGVLPWASLAVLWQPGALLAAYSPAVPAGSLSDLRFSLRFGLLGERALVKFNVLRLAVLAGLKAPLPSGGDTVWEPDTRLWGALAGFSLDYLPFRSFQVNLSGATLFNPEQATGNPAFSDQTVFHPLDIRCELEPRLNFLSPTSVVLTLPLVYEYSLPSRVRDRVVDDEQHSLSLGLGYTLAIRDFSLPFDVGMKFLAPVYGVNRPRFWRTELAVKLEIPLVK
jgi:hypothetical protein